MVAVHCANYAESPAIGKCLSVEKARIQVEWMKGTYTSSWKTWMVAVGRKRKPWVDWIPRESVILFDFELSSAGRLRKTTIDHLRVMYAGLS